MNDLSPLPPAARLLDPAKFRDPARTAKGEARATVPLLALRTLWFNTGTLCNITCRTCYIESSPSNDRLVYLSAAEVEGYLDEIAQERLPTREIGFTGGEPFLNPDILAMLTLALDRGFTVLVLTNAMQPLMRPRLQNGLSELARRHGPRLGLRVSLDHYTAAGHEAERGPGTWIPALKGLRWLAALNAEFGTTLAVAGRLAGDESEADQRSGYRALFAAEGVALDAGDHERLVLFPMMDAALDVPEITTACWSILGRDPGEVMCATSRMVVKRRGAPGPAVVSCTLLPYEPAFELGARLAAAGGPIALNHPHCARFCVLGGARCSAPG